MKLPRLGNARRTSWVRLTASLLVLATTLFGTGLPRAEAAVPYQKISVDPEPAQDAEQALASARGRPVLARVPLLESVTVTATPPVWSSAIRHVATTATSERACDRRRALRRLQSRRGVPRMNCEEPPWC